MQFSPRQDPDVKFDLSWGLSRAEIERSRILHIRLESGTTTSVTRERLVVALALLRQASPNGLHRVLRLVVHHSPSERLGLLYGGQLHAVDAEEAGTHASLRSHGFGIHKHHGSRVVHVVM